MIRFPFVIAALALISGCGFQLKSGSLELDLPTLTLTAIDAPIQGRVRAAFVDAGVRIEALPGGGDWTMTLTDQRSRAIPVAMTEDVRINELDLELSVELTLNFRGGEVFADRIMVERPVRIDRDNLVSSREERRVVLAEMRERLVEDIVRIVDAVVRSRGQSE